VTLISGQGQQSCGKIAFPKQVN